MENYQKTNWKDLYKIKIANTDESFQKHEIIKLLIVMKILNKYKRKHWIRIYTELQFNGIKPDIYFENIKTKEVICYEIQKEITKKWSERIVKKYNSYEVPFFNKIDLVIIPLKESPDSIKELNDWLEKYVI